MSKPNLWTPGKGSVPDVANTDSCKGHSEEIAAQAICKVLVCQSLVCCTACQSHVCVCVAPLVSRLCVVPFVSRMCVCCTNMCGKKKVCAAPLVARLCAAPLVRRLLFWGMKRFGHRDRRDAGMGVTESPQMGGGTCVKFSWAIPRRPFFNSGGDKVSHTPLARPPPPGGVR